MELRKRFVSLGLAVVPAAMVLGLLSWDGFSPTAVRAIDPSTTTEISLGATGASCAGDTCTVASPTGAFTITVNADVIPDGGYSGVASEVVLNGLTYNQAADCDDEVVWPDQTFCTPASVGQVGQVRHGAATTIIPPFEKSNFTGTLVQLDVACPGEGEYEVLLTALPVAPFGAGYFDLQGAPVSVKAVETRNLDLNGDTLPDARQEDTDGDTVPDSDVILPDGTRDLLNYGIADVLTITCGGGGEGQPGDADGNGTVNATDAQVILQFDAGLASSLGCEACADVNGGGVTAQDAQLILQYDAGLISSF